MPRKDSRHPRRSKLHIACSDFFQKSGCAHSAAPPFQITTAALGCDLVSGSKPESWGFESVRVIRIGAKSALIQRPFIAAVSLLKAFAAIKDLLLQLEKRCGKVHCGYGMRREGELPGAALSLMTKPDCEGARVPG